MKNRKFSCIFVLVMLALLMGCGALGKQIKPVDQMTPFEKATWFHEFYNQQYDAYLQQAAQANLTPSQRSILRTKKEILRKMEKATLAYSTFVKTGALPTVQMEQEVMGYINDLLAKAEMEGGGK